MNINKLKHYLLVFSKGVAMGAGDVVPGVSGGTIAFITGIYEELIDSLKSINLEAVKILFSKGIPAAWDHINGTFLLSLFSGVLLSVFSLAKLIGFCLENYPVLVWSFFFGLVCASIIYILKQINKWTLVEISALIIGTSLALAVSYLKPAQLSSDWWVIMLAGSVAICAMILPGISGAFILVLLGLYPVILSAITSFNFIILLSFTCGCLCGLLVFSHILSWLLHHFHNLTLALLTGFLLGSLNLLWPWKKTIETYTNRHGELVPLIRENISPISYSELSGLDSYLSFSIVFFIIGLALVLGLEALGKKK
ncbi:MAG: DUF368 domain-containing protein [Cellvibrionaceae bacterium]